MRPPFVAPAALASGLALFLGSAPTGQAAHGYDYFLTSSRSEVY
jgi:hypothetical protein